VKCMILEGTGSDITPEQTQATMPDMIIATLILAVIIIVIMIIALKISGLVFRRLQRRRQDLRFVFFQKVANVVIVGCGILLLLVLLNGAKSIGQTLLGGTAIFSAVAAFVAQDAIKDVLAGLMISIYKPFGLGDRIELEDGTVGIVKDITMRHVVLTGIDNKVIVVPNSKLNTMKLYNYTNSDGYHSMVLDFYVSYDTDVELAAKVIGEAIASSPYSIERKYADGTSAYGQVYFWGFEASALVMKTSVFYERTSSTEKVRSDVNVRVNKALAASGIEIPYNYINIVNKKV